MMKFKLKLKCKLSRSKAKIFALCNFNIKNMTYLFMGIFFGEQLISASIEYLIWGETFKHFVDPVFFTLLACSYFYYTNALGEFLLDLQLNAEEVE